MRNLHRKLGILCLLFMVTSLLVFSASVSAQDAIALVQKALDDLNQQTGQSYQLGDFNYTFEEQVYDGDNLGCPNVPKNNSGTYRAYLIRFDVNNDTFFDWEYRVSSDGTILIACSRPAVVPTGDPNIPTVTPSRCEGMTPRINIGQTARVLPGDPNLIRDIPGRSGQLLGEIPGGEVFTVLDGPRCTNDLTWWQINYNGIIGWTVESNAGEYWVEPFVPSEPTTIPTQGPDTQLVPIASPEACNTLTPRLAVGERSRVTPGYPNNVRDVPAKSGSKVGEIPGGAEFEVVAGPMCGDGLVWWQVNYNGLTGWTVEGQDDEYFLIPPTIYEPITVDSAPNVELLLETPSDLQLTKIHTLGFNTRLEFRTSTATKITYWGVYKEMYDPFFDFGDVTLTKLGVSDGSIDVFHSISPNKMLAADVTLSNVVLYDLVNPLPLMTFPVVADHIVFNQAGTQFVATETNGKVSVWDVATGSPLVRIEYSARSVDALFSADGKHILIAVDNLIEIWSVATWQEVSVLEGDLYNQKLAISPDNRWLVSTGTAGPVSGENFAERLWDLGTKTLRWGGTANGAEYFSRPIFIPDSKAFATIDYHGEYGMVRFFDVEFGDIIAGFPITSGNTLTFNVDGTILAVYEQNGDADKISMWAINSSAVQP